MDICLIYLSSSLKLLQEEDFTSLLEQSRKNNSEKGITGILLCVRGHILQVLEGDQQAVEDLFNRVEKDTRHTDVSIALKRPISQRLFPEWAMGYENLTLRELEQVKRLVNLETSNGSLLLAKSPILRILQEFYDGNRYLFD
ncbi:MAG: hypothetical protein JWP57_4329 [Spirosoma sp.]|nr:hypothetical protein [Spirosoma sp.]